MSKSPAVRVLSVALTEEERAVLDKIAESQHVSFAVIVRDLLAEEFPEFKKVLRPRVVGRPRESSSAS